MRKLYVALLSLLASSPGLRAQQPVKLSLNDCVEFALKNNYSVRNARIDVLIREQQVKQTTAAVYPHINGKADFTYANIIPAQFIDASTFPTPGVVVPRGTIIPISFSLPYAASASITTSQLLFDGSMIVALQARNTIVELAQQGEQMTAENVRYSVLKAYNSLVVAQKQFDIVKGSLTLVRSMAQDLDKMRAAGFVEKIEVDRTTVQLNNLATDSLKIANMLVVAEQVLKYNMGMDINAQIVLTDTNVEKGATTALALTTESINYDRLPTYTMLKTAVRLSEFDVKRYKYAALPSLSGFWAYGQNYGNDKFSNMFKFDSYVPSSVFGLSLNAPIFNGLIRQHQLQEAKLKVDQATNNLENLKLTVEFQASTARATLRNSLLQVQSQKRNLELSNSVMELAQKKYKAGVGSNTEVTTAQTEVLRSQNNYFQALLDVINAEADLRKALGMLK